MAEQGKPPGDVTALLVDWSRGDSSALDKLVPAVYGELRRSARQRLARMRGDALLQPTALVNELYLKLVEQRRATWQSRAHFFAVAAQMMRRIVVDHLRAQGAEKRGGAVLRISLTEAGEIGAAPAVDVLDLDDALTRLAAMDAEQARIVELRFYAGLSVEETALVLDRSERTIKREWRLARAWLFQQLQPGQQPGKPPGSSRPKD